jgi:TonB family protein
MISKTPGITFAALVCLSLVTAGASALDTEEASPSTVEARLPTQLAEALDALAGGDPKAAKRRLKASRGRMEPLSKLVASLLDAYRKHERLLPNWILASTTASRSLDQAAALAPEVPAAEYEAVLARVRSLLANGDEDGRRPELRALLCNLRMLSGEESPAKPETVIQVSNSVDPPRRAFTPVAQYTDTARANRVQGVVVSQLILDREGCVVHVQILKGLPDGLDDSVRRMHRWWAYDPATFQGEPVAVYYNVTTNFRLE